MHPQRLQRSVHFGPERGPSLNPPKQAEAHIQYVGGNMLQGVREQHKEAERKKEMPAETLYTQLQHEAEKIRKWKVQTEIDMKQKVSQLEECQKQLQTFQKSTLDLQLRNEALDLKLQEEAEARDNIIKRVNATREMCYALKSNLDRVVEQLEKCEREKECLQKKEFELVQQLQLLNDKFDTLNEGLLEANQGHAAEMASQKLTYDSLSLEYQQEVERLKQQLRNITEEKSAVTEVAAEMKALATNYEQQNDELRHQAEQLKVLLGEADESSNSLKCLTAGVEEALQNAQRELETCRTTCQLVSQQLEEKCTQLQCLQMDFTSKEASFLASSQSLNASISHLELKVAEHCERAKELQEEIKLKDVALGTLASEKEQLHLLNLVDQEVIKKLQDSQVKMEEIQQSLNLQLTEKLNKLDDCRKSLSLAKEEKEAVEAQQEVMTAAYKKAAAECEELKLSLISMTEAAKLTQDRLDIAEDERNHIREENDVLKAAINVHKEEIKSKKDAIDALSERLASKDEAEVVLRASVDTLEASLRTTRHELQLKDDLIASNVAELQEHKRRISENADRLKFVTEAMQDSRGQSATLGMELENEKFSKKMLEDQLENFKINMACLSAQSSEMLSQERLKNDGLQSKLNSLVCDMTKLQMDYQNKQDELRTASLECSNLSSQVKILQRHLEDKQVELRQSTEQIAVLQTHLQKTSEDMQATSNSYDSTVAALKAKEIIYQAAMDEILKLKGEIEESRKQHAELLSSTDLQRQEMIATIENYKLENEKVLLRKEKEIEGLNKKLDTQAAKREKEAKQAKERLTKVTDELGNVKAALDSALEAKDKMANAYAEKSTEVERLSKIVAIKEKDYSELLQAVQNIKTKVTAVAAPMTKVPDTVAPSSEKPEKNGRDFPPTTPRYRGQPGLSPPRSVLRQTANLSLSRKRQVNFISPVRQGASRKPFGSPTADTSHEFEVNACEEDKCEANEPINSVAATQAAQSVACPPKLHAAMALNYDDECLPGAKKIGKKSSEDESQPAKAAGKFFKVRGTPAQNTKKTVALKAKSKDGSFDIDTVFGFGAES